MSSLLTQGGERTSPGRASGTSPHLFRGWALTRLCHARIQRGVCSPLSLQQEMWSRPRCGAPKPSAGDVELGAGVGARGLPRAGSSSRLQ